MWWLSSKLTSTPPLAPLATSILELSAAPALTPFSTSSHKSSLLVVPTLAPILVAPSNLSTTHQTPLPPTPPPELPPTLPLEFVSSTAFDVSLPSTGADTSSPSAAQQQPQQLFDHYAICGSLTAFHGNTEGAPITYSQGITDGASP